VSCFSGHRPLAIVIRGNGPFLTAAMDDYFPDRPSASERTALPTLLTPVQSMSLPRFSVFVIVGYFFFLSFAITTGCGSSTDSTVIMPTTEYQLTDQEKSNRMEVEAARKGDR